MGMGMGMENGPKLLCLSPPNLRRPVDRRIRSSAGPRGERERGSAPTSVPCPSPHLPRPFSLGRPSRDGLLPWLATTNGKWEMEESGGRAGSNHRPDVQHAKPTVISRPA